MEAFMPLINIVGPLLLIGVLIWAFLRNRRAPKGSEARADAGAERLREDIQAEDEQRGNN